MRFLGKFVWFIALCGFGTAVSAAQIGVANLGPSGVPYAGASASLVSIQAQAQLRGMRVRTVRWDGVLQQNWAVLENVEHPDRPLWSQLTAPVAPVLEASLSPLSGSLRGHALPVVPSPPKPTVIHYGDPVRLWRIERNVRIDMKAIAEASAAIGDEVKLHIPSSGNNGDSGWRVVGVVRGPGEVEMKP